MFRYYYIWHFHYLLLKIVANADSGITIGIYNEIAEGLSKCQLRYYTMDYLYIIYHCLNLNYSQYLVNYLYMFNNNTNINNYNNKKIIRKIK